MHTILIADDEAHIRMLLEEALEEVGDGNQVNILFAADGEEALALIRRERPSLVFLDVMMPKMDGIDVCKTVKADPALAGVFIILLTAKGQEAEIKQGVDAGADIYMTKPFNPMAVMLKTEELLGI